MTDEDLLIEAAARFKNDPVGFVLYAYPWGEPGKYQNHHGPDKWQREFLEGVAEELKGHKGPRPYAPIRRAVSSGHGIGKSTLVAWLVNWIMVTRPGSHGTITANTFDQLETKTWAAIQHWTGMCIYSHWFECNTRKMYAKEDPSDWFCAPQSSKEENSEAFAGQHAEDATSFYVFDEASAIPDKIYEVAEGGLTDGEPMIFLFGNPTRGSGAFHRAAFGSQSRFGQIKVDSRDSSLTNKTIIDEWIKDHGEDSDFVRVRVLGMPPRASELQFIDQTRVDEAKARVLPQAFGDEPLVAGVDVSDGGAAWNVVRFRRGNDARSFAPIRIPGEKVRGDRGAFLGVLAEILRGGANKVPVAAMFVDSAFGAPYVERLQSMGFPMVQEVRFGSDSLDHHQANRRAYMWNAMKEWLGRQGCIDPKDSRLEMDLIGPGYHINKQDRLVIESKEDMAKRGVDSPDDADALALTFASRVGPKAQSKTQAREQPWGWG
jgi:hypothetical protein